MRVASPSTHFLLMKAKAEIKLGDGSTVRVTQPAGEIALAAVQMDPGSVLELESVDRGGSTAGYWLRVAAVASVREL